jgi:hypothetical protein
MPLSHHRSYRSLLFSLYQLIRCVAVESELDSNVAIDDASVNRIGLRLVTIE